MNTLDWIVVAVIVISALTAYYRGFIYTIFQTLSTITSIIISYLAYRPVNIILRSIGLYEWLKNLTIKMLFSGEGPKGLYEQAKLIEELRLPIPNSIKEGIVRNNNPEIYNLLGVHNFKEYIGGYVANFYLSIIAFIVVCLIVKIILCIVGGSLQIIAKLPIIRFADKWAGLGVGVIKGVIIVWIGTAILTFLIVFPSFKKIWELLSNSMIAKWFYENNIILHIIDQVFI